MQNQNIFDLAETLRLGELQVWLRMSGKRLGENEGAGEGEIEAPVGVVIRSGL